MSDDYRDIITLLDSLGGIADTFTGFANSNNQLAQIQQAEEYKNFLKMENDERALDLQAVNAVNKQNFDNATTDLAESLSTLESHGVTRDKYQKSVLAPLRTDEMKEILDSQSIEITDDFQFILGEVTSHAEKLERNAHAAEYMNNINKSLDSMETEITGLQDRISQVSLDKGIKGMRDLADFETYVQDPNNAHLFKEPNYLTNENGDIIVKNGKPMTDGTYGDELNYLGTAFLAPERWNMAGKRGFVKSYTQSEQNQAIAKMEKEVKINDNFERLNLALAATDDEFKDRFNMHKFPELKGAKDLYNNPEAAIALREDLENTILKMFDHGSVWEGPLGIGSWATGSLKEFRDSIGFEKESMDLPGQKRVWTDRIFMNDAVMRMHERYIQGIPNYDKDGNIIGYTDKPKIEGRLNQDYATDNLYFTSALNPSDDIYGKIPEDEVYYNLLKLWKELDDVYPGNVSGVLNNLEK